MNDLNNDFVLWISLGALGLSVVSLIVFGWKATRAIEGLEEGNDTVPPADKQ